MAADYLFRSSSLFNREAIVLACGETYQMYPPYPQIFQAYLFASGEIQCKKVPVGLVHGKDVYLSAADLELRPWIDIHNDQGVTPLADHLLQYQLGDLIFNIFIDPQDRRKADSPHFRGWQGNVLVVHEVGGKVIEASDDDIAFVKEAVKSTLDQQKRVNV